MMKSPFALARRSMATSTSAIVGGALACLWAAHAATRLPGQGYVRMPLLVVVSVGLLLWRAGSHSPRSPRANKCGLTVGLACWFFGATLSCLLNWKTDEVLLTYCAVFLCGAAIFVALSGVSLSSAHLDIAIVGLAIGSMFPLINGLLAFAGEWGVPDMTTAVSAYKNVLRMHSYEEITFGNRGNTAAFIVILAPMLLSILLDKRKRRALRAFCAVTLIPVALNLLVLQVRAAFLTLLAALVIVWVFRCGIRRLPVLFMALVLGWLLLFKFQPEVGSMLTDEILPVITADTEGDTSVQGRADAIKEGWQIAERHWLLGIGPGGALTIHSRDSAHQFQVQQAMETGILGLIGATLFSFGVLAALFRTVVRGRRDEVNDIRFLLLIGPASYVTYSIMANAALNSGSLNTWTVLIASMLALMPPFSARARVSRTTSAPMPGRFGRPLQPAAAGMQPGALL